MNKELLIFLIFLTLAQVLGWSGSGARSGVTALRGLGNPRSSSNSQKSVYNGLGNANGDPGYNQPSVAARQSSPHKKTSRGLGLSAWGIVGVLLVFIIGGIVIYYVILFYPIICKKERKYDIMELNSV